VAGPKRLGGVCTSVGDVSMCGAGDETSRADKRELCWTTAQSRTI
jgi:hypothetical protein